ncbi:hypothetical protein CWI38_1033p0020 [Hamiltosporidium tvaerminnensis]|uniref:Uncharacterized protein n=1 Tax=Hamiltosporidium tvaerminnensis TaxID=1176355 RepID=A0A4V2JXH2_9MICR|nr:hypothetical protein CWI38_1033p0020 [Hamiltosporidium tvaerminnensis]
MSNSFSGKNTGENKYHFHVGQTLEYIECENDNGSVCFVETSGSRNENLSLTTILTPRKQIVCNNDLKRTIVKTMKGHLMSAIASMYRINYQTVNSILTLEIKECLETYVDLEGIKTLITFNVNAPHIPLHSKAVTLVPEPQDQLRNCFRELVVNYDDKNFVFLNKVGRAVETRPSRGCNKRGESACLSYFSGRSNEQICMIYHKTYERIVNEKNLKLSNKEIYESCKQQKILTSIFVMNNARISHNRGLNEDEEIACNSWWCPY